MKNNQNNIYTIWSEYFLKPLPLTDSNLDKLAKKEDNILFSFLKNVPKCQIKQSQFKKLMQNFKKPEEIDQALGNLFGLKMKMNVEQLEILRLAIDYNFKESNNKDVKEFIEMSIMRILIISSFEFEKELNVVLSGKTSTKFSIAFWSYFPFFFNYFENKNGKILNDFLLIVSPMLDSIAKHLDDICKPENDKSLIDLLPSLMNVLLVFIKKEKTVTIPNYQFNCFNFCISSIEYLLKQNKMEYFDLTTNFLNYLTPDCDKLPPNVKVDLIAICINALLIKKDKIDDKKSEFQLFLACCTILLKISDGDILYLQHTFGFMQWFFESYFDPKFKIPKFEEINYSIPIDTQIIEFTDLKSISNLLTPLLPFREISIYQKFKESISFMSFFNLLKEFISKKLKYESYSCEKMIKILMNLKTPESIYSFVYFIVDILQSINSYSNYYKLLQDNLYYLFNPSIFSYTSEHFDDEFTRDSHENIVLLILNFGLYMLTIDDETRKIIIISFIKSATELINENKDFQAYYLISHLFSIFQTYTLCNTTNFVEKLNEKYIIDDKEYFFFTPIFFVFTKFPNSKLSTQIYQLILAFYQISPSSFLKNRDLSYFLIKSIPSERFYKATLELFLNCLLTNDKDVEDNSELIINYISEIFEDLVKSNKKDLLLTFLKLFNAKITNMDLSKNTNIFNAIINIPILINTKESFVEILNFLQQSHYLNYESYIDKIISNLFPKISKEIIDLDILVSSMFGKQSKFGDIKTISNHNIIKTLISLNENSEEHFKIYDYINALVLDNYFNGYKCIKSNILQECVKHYLISNAEETKNFIIDFIHKVGLNQKFLIFVFSLLHEKEKREKLKWVVSEFYKMSCKKNNEPLSFIILKDPIRITSIDKSVFNDEWEFETTFFYDSENTMTLIQLFSSSASNIIIYLSKNLIYIKTGPSKTPIHFNQLFEFNTFYHIVLKFTKNSVSLNSNELLNFQNVVFDSSPTITFGNKGLYLADTYIKNNENHAVEFMMKTAKNGKVNYLPNQTISFKGNEVHFNKAFLTLFEDIPVLEEFFKLFSINEKEFVDELFDIFKNIYNQETFQNFMEENKGIRLFYSCIYNIKDEVMSTEIIDKIAELIDNTKLDEFKMKMINAFWLAPSLWFKHSSSISYYYSSKILPNLLPTHKSFIIKLFQEQDILEDFCYGLSQLNYEKAETDKITVCVWEFLCEIIDNIHTNAVLSSLIQLISGCSSEPLRMVMFSYIEDRLTKKDQEFINVLESFGYYGPFIILLQKGSFPIQRLSLRCLKKVQTFIKQDEFNLMNEIFNFINVLKFSPNLSMTLISDCFDLMGSIGFIESLPIASILTSTLPIEEGKKVIECLGEFANNLSTYEIDILSIPFGEYWLLIIWINCQHEDEQIISPKLIDIFFKIIDNEEINLKYITQIFSEFDVISSLIKFNFNNLKIKLLIKICEKYNDKIQELSQLIFSTIFVKINFKEESNIKDNFTFNIEDLKTEYKNILDTNNVVGFFEMDDNNKLCNIELFDYFINCATDLISKKITINFSDNLKLPLELIFGYLLSVKIRNEKSKELDETLFNKIITKSPDIDDDIEHQFIGVLLKGIKSTHYDFDDSLIVQELYNRFKNIDDEFDSPEYQCFIFEDFLQSHLKDLLPISFLQNLT